MLLTIKLFMMANKELKTIYSHFPFFSFSMSLIFPVIQYSTMLIFVTGKSEWNPVMEKRDKNMYK